MMQSKSCVMPKLGCQVPVDIYMNHHKMYIVVYTDAQARERTARTYMALVKRPYKESLQFPNTLFSRVMYNTRSGNRNTPY